jgi:hypothetical protein
VKQAHMRRSTALADANPTSLVSLPPSVAARPQDTRELYGSASFGALQNTGAGAGAGGTTAAAASVSALHAVVSPISIPRAAPPPLATTTSASASAAGAGAGAGVSTPQSPPLPLPPRTHHTHHLHAGGDKEPKAAVTVCVWHHTHVFVCYFLVLICDLRNVWCHVVLCCDVMCDVM